MTDSGMCREYMDGKELGLNQVFFGSKICTPSVLHSEDIVGGPVESLEAGRPFWGDCRGPSEKYEHVGQQ